MPRANRYWLPGHIWHLTHRCHRRQFLLRFGCDRRLWTMWLYEARVRHGLCVLNYMVTSNHVHLVVRDRGRGEVAASMQLLEGCTGQAYNRRKQRLGAFWQDRYHATAVESGEHLARCIVYVDLNMVRAGVVAHPREWAAGGYHEIQGQRQRYRIVDRAALAEALEVDVEKLTGVHHEWVEGALRRPLKRQAEWSESVAVGGRPFAERVLRDLGRRARDRRIEPFDGAYVVREPFPAYAAYFTPENERYARRGVLLGRGTSTIPARFRGPTPLRLFAQSKSIRKDRAYPLSATIIHYRLWFAVATLACSLWQSSCSSDATTGVPVGPAETVLVGANIYTLNPDLPWATALAITRGQFVHVGDESSVESFVGEDTKVVDLEGRLVLPGFIDAHAHPLLSAGLSYALLVDPSLGPRELVEVVRSYAAANPNAEVVLGFGFDASHFGPEGPRKELLDEAVNDRPAMIIDEGSHSAWVNSKLIEVLGIGPDTPDPVPGVHYYQRDEDGVPTGWFIEGETFYPALAELDAFDADEASNPSSLVYRLFVLGGVTTVFDAGAFSFEEQALGIAREMDRQGTLPFRLVVSHVITNPRQVEGAVERFSELRRQYDGDRLRVGMIKIVNDGTTQALNAAYLRPYETVDSRGAVLLAPELLRNFVLEADRAQIDLHIHAIGDRAVRDALDAFEVARRDDPNRGTRHTIAHLELIDDADLPRFAELDVIAQTTPAWHSYNGQEVLEVLGQERFDRLYRFRELLDAGVRVTFGSDFPASGIAGAWPAYNMAIGATRQLPGEPIQGDAKQRLTIEELVRGYTIDAAYQLRMEDEIGSVEEGKRADLVILRANIFELPPEALFSPLVDATILDGEVVTGVLPN